MATLPEALEPFFAQRASGALFVDFDGTLAPTVPNPSDARPLPGSREVLEALAQRMALVAVVSGRPAQVLDRWLGRPRGVPLVGLYGLETADGGEVRAAEGAEPWRAVLSAAAERAAAQAPPGVLVEPKGLGLTVHWRGDPSQEPWVRRFAHDEGVRTGLVTRPARLSLELAPPLHHDKGTVVRALMAGMTAGAYFGDDVGDLPAFAALAEFRSEGVLAVCVAVVHDETPPEVPAAADVVVDGGPAGALQVLRALAER